MDGGGFEDLGSEVTITNSDLGTTVTVNIVAATFESLSGGLMDGEMVTFNAIITDEAGNATTGTASSNTIQIDQSPPAAFTTGTVSAVGGTAEPGFWNTLNTSIGINIPVANEASLEGGTLQLRANVDGGGFEDLGSEVTITHSDLGTTVTVTISAATLEALSGGLEDGETVTFNAVITDAAGNATTGTASSSAIRIDQSPPAAFTTGNVSAVGGTVVAGVWNSTNTSLDIDVAVTNDATLENGTIQLRASVEGGGFEDLGSEVTITNSNLGTTVTVNIAGTTFEALSGGLNDGETVTFNAIVADEAGNTTTGTVSGTTLFFDETPPAAFTTGAVSVLGGSVEPGFWNGTNTSIDINVLADNDATLENGTLQLRADVNGGGFEDLGSEVTITNGDLGATVTINIAAATFEALSGGLNDGETVTFNAIITDARGNVTTGTASATIIEIDQAAPAAFTTGTVSVVGGTAEPGFWNISNTRIDINVPVTGDASLENGTLQLRADVDGGGFEDLGSEVTITNGDLGTTVTISIAGAAFESLSGGLVDGETVTFNAIIIDEAGNSTAGAASSNTIQIDQSPPAAFTTGDVSALGGTRVPGFWNGTNTTIDIGVPIANDATLENGTIQLRADVDGGGFEDLGSEVTITNSDLGTTVTINVAAATFEALSGGLVDGETVTFNAILTDVGGNATTGTASAVTVEIDQTAPSSFTVAEVRAVGGLVMTGSWNFGNTSVNVSVPIENDASLEGGSIQLRADVNGGGFEDFGGATGIANADLGAIKTINLSAATLEALSSGLVDGEVVTVNAVITDRAGNSTTGIASARTLEVDQTVPVAFNTGNVSPVGGPTIAGFWNSGNTSLNIEVPIANDASLGGGSIFIEADVNGGGFEPLGSLINITNGDLGTTVTVNVTASTFEVLNSRLTGGETVAFRASLRDNAGNTTTGTVSTSTIEFDETAPAAFTVGNVSAVGGTVVAGFWNSTNNRIDVEVPITNDPTLENGSIQLRAEVDGGGFENLGTAVTITNSDLGTTVTVNVPGAIFEALSSDLSNGETITFNAILTDKAGNPTIGTVSATLIEFDEELPAITATSPGDDNINVDIETDIIITFSKNITFGTGNIEIIDLDDGASSITIDAASPGPQASIAGNVLTLNPASALELNVNYAVQIANTAVLDGAGNAYAGITGNTTLNFTTINAPVIRGLTDLTFLEDTEGVLTFQLESPATGEDALVVTATLQDEQLISQSNLVITGLGAERTITLSPHQDANGTVQLTVSVTGGDLTTEQTITVVIIPVNDAPTDIALSGGDIDEEAPAGTGVGTLTATDVDADQTFTFTLVAGIGDTHNHLFAINGDMLEVSSPLDFEDTPTVSVRIRVTDQDGAFYEKVFTRRLIANPEADLVFYTAFTPDGDGVNDTWTIDNITLHPGARVMVVNSEGNAVFESVGYEQPWDGTFNGNVLPLDTYYYVVELPGGRNYKGVVTILK